MKLKIDPEFEKLIPPMADDELKGLEKNLLNEGWRNNEAIIVWNNTIVDGHNRYHLCQKHNIKFNIVEMSFKDKNEVIVWMIDNQLGKRNLNNYNKTVLALKKEEILKPIARANQGKRTDLVPTLARSNIGKVRDVIAQSAKVSHGTVDKVKFILAKADDEIKAKLGKDKATINEVYTNLKKKEQREKVIHEFKEAPKLELKNKKYRIIYADPPWKYFAGGNKNQALHYKGMEMEEIKKLPVQNLADKDCILFLWVTFPILKEAFEVIESWGFEYATCGFTWVKRNKSGEGWFFGLGNWTRSNAELCLIARRGKPIRLSASVSQIIDNPIEEHSKKPNVVRDKIIELCGNLPRIELFARDKVDGWDVWGNQVSNDKGGNIGI